MNVFITGGLGFVGRHVAAHFLSLGHRVTITDLAPRQGIIDHPLLTYMMADTTSPGPWRDHAAAADVIVNLAGVPIFGRWTKSLKRRIYDSRILTTRTLVEALPGRSNAVLYSTSAQGYYGFHGDEILTEKDAPGSDFLATVCRDWEAEALRAREKGARVVLTRFGIVMGRRGGVLGLMAPLFRLFAGGPLGSGAQWFSWVHLEDLTAAYLHILERSDVEGPVNFTSPSPVTNRDFARALGRALRRPAFMPAPAFAVKLLLGEFGETILKGQRVTPAVLTELGYAFKFPTIQEALADIFR